MAEPHPEPRVLHDLSTPSTGVVLRWTTEGVVVAVSGELDLACGPQLAAVSGALALWAHRAVVDASGVTFVDVSGLQALLALAPAGGSLLVLEPSAPLLRLVDLLHEHCSWPQALAAGPRELALVLRRPAVRDAEGAHPGREGALGRGGRISP